MFSKARMDINELQVQEQSPTYSAITISDSHLSQVDKTTYLPQESNDQSYIPYSGTCSFVQEEDTLFWNRIEALLQMSPLAATSVFIDHHIPIHEIERLVRRPLSHHNKVHSKMAYIVVFQQNGITFRVLMERVTVLLYPNGAELLRKFRKKHQKRNGSTPNGGERRRSPRNRPSELEAEEANELN